MMSPERDVLILARQYIGTQGQHKDSAKGDGYRPFTSPVSSPVSPYDHIQSQDGGFDMFSTVQRDVSGTGNSVQSISEIQELRNQVAGFY